MQTVPNTYFRATVKAVIRNDKNEVLLLKEANGRWGLPGGGVDHGESLPDALLRELQEELGITAITSQTLVSAYPFYSRVKETWWLWLVYEVTAELPSVFKGELAKDAAFIDIETFKNSEDTAELRIYDALHQK